MLDRYRHDINYKNISSWFCETTAGLKITNEREWKESGVFDKHLPRLSGCKRKRKNRKGGKRRSKTNIITNVKGICPE